MGRLVFDRPYEVSFVGVRLKFLAGFLPHLVGEFKLRTALDVGCGVGYFSSYLSGLGLEVTGWDIRPANVAEAKKRYEGVNFSVMDIESEAVKSLPRYDLTVCFGLLYHLENPFRAIRNLVAITQGILVVESLILPENTTKLTLVDEPLSENQSLRYISFLPSEACVVKMLYRAGFAHVYRPAKLPDHREFRGSLTQKRRRTFLIALMTPLSLPGWLRAEEVYRPYDGLWARGLARVLNVMRRDSG